MTRPSYLAHRLVCWFIATHEMDWIYQHMTGHRRCIHCHQSIAPITVGNLHPDSGD